MSRIASSNSVMGGRDVDLAHTVERLDNALDVIRREYLRKHRDPWVIAYSGGKDSTLLLQLTWEILAALPDHERRRKVYVVGNDTLVESPLVVRHLYNSMKTIRAAASDADLPIEVRVTKPNVDQTFWVNVIGRGYIPPTRNFRWCTDRMKIIPTSRLLKEIVLMRGRVVLLVGIRRSESAHRRRNMAKRGVSEGKMNPHNSVKGCRIFAPLAEFDNEDVWLTLMQRKPPWGDSHDDLVTLYRNAAGGECPLVLTKDDAPSCGTTSPRFGCWTCTVVVKDRSLQGLIASGNDDAGKLEILSDFREWLVELRENQDNRLPVRRDGATRRRADGSRVFGPFRLDVRKRILKRLQNMEMQLDERLIGQAEIDHIKDIWWRDEIIESGRISLQNALQIA